LEFILVIGACTRACLAVFFSFLFCDSRKDSCVYRAEAIFILFVPAISGDTGGVYLLLLSVARARHYPIDHHYPPHRTISIIVIRYQLVQMLPIYVHAACHGFLVPVTARTFFFSCYIGQ
jgi:hypothetical protein